MVQFSKIQQLQDILEAFRGNFRTICPRFEIFGSFGLMESAPGLSCKLPITLFSLQFQVGNKTVLNHFTGPLNNMRTLKFKAQPTNAFFATE